MCRWLPQDFYVGQRCPAEKSGGGFSAHMSPVYHYPGIKLCQTRKGLLAKSYTPETTSTQAMPFNKLHKGIALV